MPTYMGKLSLSTPEETEALRNQDPMSISVALQAQEGQAERLLEQNPAHSAIERGKKLDTDLAIVMENAAAGFVKPNILDVKLGSRLWGDDAPPHKRVRLDKVSGDTTSGSLGFRIAGMRVWRPATSGDDASSTNGSYQIFDKQYGRSFTRDNVREGFEEFFLDCTGGDRRLTAERRLVLESCRSELARLQEALENEESRMYSSSILLIYEGDHDTLDRHATRIEEMQEESLRKVSSPVEAGEASPDDDEDDDEEEEEPLPTFFAVKLIDFAHAAWTPGQGPDENVLRGVRSVDAIIKDVLRTT